MPGERQEAGPGHHTTGEDCYLIRLYARSMAHLEELTSKLGTFGETTTALSYSTPIPMRSLLDVALNDQ